MSDDESVSSSCDEEIQAGYPKQTEDVASSAADGDASNGGELVRALTVDDVQGARTATFHADLPEGATLETLQRDYPNGYKWKPTEGQKLRMLHINRTNDRANATSEDYVGSKAKWCILGAKITHDIPDTPKKLGVIIHGLVPSAYTSTGQIYNHVIAAGSSGERSFVNSNVFEPTHVFSLKDYESDAKLTRKQLNSAIRVDKKLSTIEYDTSAWRTLKDNVKNGTFSDFPELKSEMKRCENRIAENPDYVQPLVVPYPVAKAVHAALDKKVTAVEKSYTNIDEFYVMFKPANDQPWTSPVGLIRESLAYGEESKQVELAQETNRPLRAGVVIEMQYIFGNE
jgi:hypothetical protein